MPLKYRFSLSFPSKGLKSAINSSSAHSRSSPLLFLTFCPQGYIYSQQHNKVLLPFTIKNRNRALKSRRPSPCWLNRPKTSHWHAGKDPGAVTRGRSATPHQCTQLWQGTCIYGLALVDQHQYFIVNGVRFYKKPTLVEEILLVVIVYSLLASAIFILRLKTLAHRHSETTPSAIRDES